MTRGNWENDGRALKDSLQAWRAQLKFTRQKAADKLGVPLNTLNGWIVGRPCRHELMVRRLMTCIATRDE